VLERRQAWLALIDDCDGAIGRTEVDPD